MTQTLTLQIPEELFTPLQALAQQSGKTPEAFTLDWLMATLRDFEQDPIEPFIGSIQSDIPDWTEKSDMYLGDSIADLQQDT
jgi:hypothetical protein